LGCNIIHPQKKGRLSLLRLLHEGLLLQKMIPLGSDPIGIIFAKIVPKGPDPNGTILLNLQVKIQLA
jgi:hypothetical protein